MNYTEILGYLASILVASSLVMKSMIKLRWINLAGCILFVIYGLFKEMYPVALVNGFGAIVNIYYLSRKSTKE